jgi:hypothetical protein
VWRLFVSCDIRKRDRSPLFEITFVLVRFDKAGNVIVSANHSVM